MSTTKLHLYRIEYDQDIQIEISLDMRVDLLWWVAGNRREKDIQRIWLIATDIPAGWGLQQRRMLKRKSYEDSLHIFANLAFSYSGDREPLMNNMNATPILLWQRDEGYTSEGQRLLDTSDAGELKENRLHATSAGELKENKLHTTSSADVRKGNMLDAAVKRQLVCGAISITGLLNGRSLLIPEFQRLLEDRQSPYLTSWRSCVQLAYLQKQIRILSAVYPQQQSAMPISLVERLKQQLATISAQAPSSQPSTDQSIRCRRCNSTRVRYTPCASCGSSSCGYCEECLNMGRSRECGIILQAVRPPILSKEATSDLKEPVTVKLTSHVSRETLQQLQHNWGLSIPQAQAAGKALLFLQDRLSTQPEAFLYKSMSIVRNKYSAIHNRRSIPLEYKQLTDSSLQDRAEQHYVHSQPRFLMWAVTGAGKTEMTFPLVDYMLRQQGRVLIATPRRDVVLELAPRISRAFPTYAVTVLYGGSEQRWQEGQIVIATTHQLLRYTAAFDLVIIDEIDAFPYEGNPMLHYAASQVCLPTGKFVYLSATPSTALQRQIKAGTLSHAKVPSRFHGHPLPVPYWLKMAPFSYWVKKRSIPHSLMSKLQHSIARDAQIFWFVPRIDWIVDMVALIQYHFPHVMVAGTSSQDESRAEKVIAFRERHIRVLVTTTILERGVTVPQSDVYIIEANHSVYRTAALIQMAGRAGRSEEDPAGKVVFAATERTHSQQEAIRQIRLMNKVARREGYIK
ncbi:helicase-related protein [Paenibacillus kandeliae]|uniref:helicase-related protein n=1 Tax=Paenibacillus kandeliae TaxID=3231269 RepID=UPI003458EF5F